MTRTHQFLQGFFWFAFAAFLSASIPHVAYFFRAYEPSSDLLVWWIVSYGIAISIDVTIFLLSVTVASMHRQNSKKSLIFSVWLFILGLAALSWFINYKYAEHFMNTNMVSPTSVTVPYLGTIPDINPFIASMFQALAIAYTWIADKIATNEQVKTAAELKIEADELEQSIQEKNRIAALKRAGKVNVFTGLFDSGKAIVNHVLTPGDTQGLNEQEHTQNEYTDTLGTTTQEVTVKAGDTLQVQQERNTDKLTPISEQNASDSTENNTGIEAPINEQDTIKKDSSSGAPAQKSVTIKEAALLLTMRESYVRTLVNNGKLRHTPRNRKMILMSSINSYIASRKDVSKESEITQSKTPLTIVPDEQVNTDDSHTITLSFVEQKMYDALVTIPEETQELLQLSQEQSIDDFTNTLKQRYSQYDSYITPERVSHVLAYARLHPEHYAELSA